MSKALIYGCYGYTGRLVAEEAARRNIPVVLSGRDRFKVQALGEELGLEAEPVGLDDPAALDAVLEGVAVVVHCAGPFSRTSAPMAEACLRTGTHYLDITGEIAVFEALAALDARARAAGVMLLPGVGFDVVPTDCVAAMLKAKLPDANWLDLAFKSVGAAMSHGTASTMIESLGESSYVRRDGKIVPARVGKDEVKADFGRGPEVASGIPWGDVSTAYYTTGIPNVTTYTVVGKRARRFLGLAHVFGPVLRNGAVRKLLQRRIDRAPAGPDAGTRERAISLVWGRARNAAGAEACIRLRTLNGYTLTVEGALHCAGEVLAGRFEAGFQTPAGMYGPELIRALDPEVVVEDC